MSRNGSNSARVISLYLRQESPSAPLRAFSGRAEVWQKGSRTSLAVVDLQRYDWNRGSIMRLVRPDGSVRRWCLDLVFIAPFLLDINLFGYHGCAGRRHWPMPQSPLR